MANAPQKQAARTANGQFRPGVSGNATGNVHRSRHALNSDTIREMHAAFRRGGRAAIDKVMKQQPAVFLKLLVLLVPREMIDRQLGHLSALPGVLFVCLLEFRQVVAVKLLQCRYHRGLLIIFR
jgi:hypothetical protein